MMAHRHQAPFEACWREVQEETGGLRRAGCNEAATPGFLTKEMFGSHIKCFRLDMGDGGTKHYYVMKHSPHGEEGLDTLVAGTVIVDLPSHYRAGKVCMLDLRGKCKKVGRHTRELIEPNRLVVLLTHIELVFS
jgi:hypothetical protein